MSEDDLTLVFDLGGVLIDWNPRHLYRKVFMDRESEMDFFLEEICPAEWNAAQDRGRSIREAVRERVELFPAYEPLIRIYYGRWEEMVSGPIDGTVSILRKLKKSGYQLAALSNWSAETFPRVADRFEFLSWFDPLVISGEIEMVKPEPDIYHHLLEKIAKPASSCLFIDDKKENIQTARDLGFQAIQFSAPDQLSSQLRNMGVLNGRI